MSTESRGLPEEISSDQKLGITDVFHFNGGENAVNHHEEKLRSLKEALESCIAKDVFVKVSNESQYQDFNIASPGVMNHKILIEGLKQDGWSVDHSSGRNKKDLAKSGLEPKNINDQQCKLKLPSGMAGTKTIDGKKDETGLEVQFGKYFSMSYDLLVKMPHFMKEDRIDYGVEVVPSNALRDKMSTGVGYFEQIVGDLHHLGDDYVSGEHSLPVTILGIGFESEHKSLEQVSKPNQLSKQQTLG